MCPSFKAGFPTRGAARGPHVARKAILCGPRNQMISYNICWINDEWNQNTMIFWWTNPLWSLLWWSLTVRILQKTNNSINFGSMRLALWPGWWMCGPRWIWVGKLCFKVKFMVLFWCYVTRASQMQIRTCHSKEVCRLETIKTVIKVKVILVLF